MLVLQNNAFYLKINQQRLENCLSCSPLMKKSIIFVYMQNQHYSSSYQSHFPSKGFSPLFRGIYTFFSHRFCKDMQEYSNLDSTLSQFRSLQTSFSLNVEHFSKKASIIIQRKNFSLLGYIPYLNYSLAVCPQLPCSLMMEYTT